MSNKNLGNRRDFIKSGTAASIGTSLVMGGLAHAQQTKSSSPNEKVVIGVMGVSRNSRGGDGRGSTLAKGFAGLENVEVAYVCDVDQRNLPKAIESVTKNQERTPKGVEDFRRILDDKSVDAMVVATPDHWHAPAAILGCKAGKHIYVEKPCCHNPQEGEWLVKAARQNKRTVQHGTQRRSWPALVEGIKKLHDGVIGNVYSANCYYFNNRPSIGTGKKLAVPEWLNWELWQGPAPRTDFRSNFVHYNWHWFWKWGTAECGNNGVHMIDVARWGLQVGVPERVTTNGAMVRYKDDQETPNMSTSVFHFGNRMITWEARSWNGKKKIDPQYEVIFYGEKGMMGIRGGTYDIFDNSNQLLSNGSGRGGDPDHLQNFVSAIRGDDKLNAEIEEGYKTALACHLANMAYRTETTIKLDPERRKLVDNPEAEKLWGREYANVDYAPNGS